jgi:hypothetical protein
MSRPYEMPPPPPAPLLHPPAQRRDHRRNLGIGLIIGGLVTAVAGFASLNSGWVLRWQGGNLSQMHGLCSSALVQAFGGKAGIAACGQVDLYYNLATLAQWGGLVLAAVGLAVLLIRGMS